VQGLDGGAAGGGVFERGDFFAELAVAIFVGLEAGDEAGDAGELGGEIADAAADFETSPRRKGATIWNCQRW